MKHENIRFFIRHARLPDDYTDISDVLNDEHPDWPTTPEELAYEDAARDPGHYQATLVAEQIQSGSNRLVGIAYIRPDMLAYREGKFLIGICVRPGVQGCSIGKQLYQAIVDHLTPLKPCELQTEVWETHPRAVRFITDRDFVETWRRIDSFLDISQFDTTAYIGLEEYVSSLGITIKTYAELEYDPDLIAKLHALDWELWQDIPYGQSLTQRSLQQFTREELQSLQFLPEACFIATYGNEFVGYSKVIQGDNYLMTDMTGVRSIYRGKKIATLLKLRGIQYAQAQDNLQLHTTNDANNTAMLALNTKLGFQYQGATIRYMKRLSS